LSIIHPPPPSPHFPYTTLFRSLGATKPQDGLEKPQLTLAFTTSPDNKASHKLIIGAPASDGTWCAHVDGREGTFVISNSDLNNLRVALVAQPLPMPSPTPSVTPLSCKQLRCQRLCAV